MTLLSRNQDIDATARQSYFAAERESHYQRNLVLEVYRQIFDRFGPVPDVLLVELAHAPVEQLTDVAHCLYASSSLDQFVSSLGWELPQGGEGNFSFDLTHRSKDLPSEERRQIQERLSCLRRAQRVHNSGAPASLRPEPLPESARFAKAKRVTAAAPPAELLALKYEHDPLSRAYLQRASCARTEGKSHGYHEGTLGTLIAVLSTQLQQRFGELPAWAEARLASASPTQLYDWVKRVLSADSLESALDSEALPPESAPL